MIIRKKYRIESAHIVRNAVSVRCSHSYHGHSGVIEVYFRSEDMSMQPQLDNAGMIYDFGAFKKTIGSFIDMFDHSVHLWDKDNQESIKFFTSMNDRYIILPCNPTAENYSLLFRDCINEILQHSTFTNGEGNVKCIGVRYHETESGYAESEETDSKRFSINDLVFSEKTLLEASPKMQKIICDIKKEKRV